MPKPNGSVIPVTLLGQAAAGQAVFGGPMAQDFFAAFGHDGVGTIGTPTTLTSGDIDGILMIGVKALAKRSEELRSENESLKAAVEELKAELKTLRTHAFIAGGASTKE